VGPRGKRGKQGAKGPQGRTGLIGRRGKIGKPGTRGGKGLRGPQFEDSVLVKVMPYFDDVYKQLGIQLERIADIQQQVDSLIAQSKRKNGRD